MNSKFGVFRYPHLRCGFTTSASEVQMFGAFLQLQHNTILKYIAYMSILYICIQYELSQMQITLKCGYLNTRPMVELKCSFNWGKEINFRKSGKDVNQLTNSGSYGYNDLI